FVNEEIKNKWEGFESDLQLAKLKTNLIQKVDKFILEFKTLKEKFQFDVILEKIDNLITETQKFKIRDYLKKLDDLKSDAKSAKESYLKKITEIDELEKTIKNNQKTNILDDLQCNCEKIIQISKLVDKPEIYKKYSIILEQTESEIEKRSIFIANQKKLKKELSIVETELKSSFKAMDIKTADEALKKGESILENIADDSIKENWVLLKKELEEVKVKKKLIEEIELFLEESNNLKEKFLIKELESKINNFISRSKEFNLVDYLEKLNLLKNEVDSIKDKYKNTIDQIKSIETKINNSQNANLLEDVLECCKKVIQLANIIKKTEIVEKYTFTLEQTEKAIEKVRIYNEKQDKLTIELSQLESEFEPFMKTMDLINVGKIIEKSKVLLMELVNNEIKENWDLLNRKYLAGKNLIENVVELSKSGLKALKGRSYDLSVMTFEKIINQLQEYQKL
ncbi:MAG: hypothetical protein ACW99L_18455, partial [Promethearchaeota archaeon]